MLPNAFGIYLLRPNTSGRQCKSSLLVFSVRHQQKRTKVVMSSMHSTVAPFLSELSDMEDASLDGLQRRIQSFVRKYGHMCRLSVATAGGGGTFLSTLASTPGASRILLQGSILYDRESYRRFIQRNLPSESFKYASYESSEYAAHAALKSGLALAAAADPKYEHHPTHNLHFSIGIGSASALSSNDGTLKRSRAYSTVLTSDSFKVTLEARLAKTGDESKDRTRFEEDIFAAHCILTSLEYTLFIRKELANICSNGNRGVHVDESCQTKRGDEIRIQAHLNQECTTQGVLQQAAKLILDGKEESVLLLARPIAEVADIGRRPEFQIVNQTVLPPLSLVFPGSFFPPHIGHVQLAKAAMKAGGCEIVWFELSLTNADKPPLEMEDVVERITGFLRLREEMPTHWGILLTNAPLFKQKVDLLYPLQVSRQYDDDQQEVLPPLHFVIGTDTLVRILNTKYYNDSHDQMIAALRSMPCHFVVGGRVEQKNVDPSKGPVFVTGQEDVDGLPEDLKPNFTLLDGFRVDISSTEIRRQISADTQGST